MDGCSPKCASMPGQCSWLRLRTQRLGRYLRTYPAGRCKPESQLATSVGRSAQKAPMQGAVELGAQGGALLERTTTTRTAKDGTATTTVRERFTPPDWRADGWFLERRHPAEWSRRTELVVPDHEKAAAVDPLVGVHDELRLARPCARARLAHRREAAPRRSVHSIRARRLRPVDRGWCPGWRIHRRAATQVGSEARRRSQIANAYAPRPCSPRPCVGEGVRGPTLDGSVSHVWATYRPRIRHLRS